MNKTISLKVMFISGQIMYLEFQTLNDVNVEHIKEAIREQDGTKPEDIIYKLIFAGKSLEDGREVLDYGMKTGSELYCIRNTRNRNVEEDEQLRI